MKTLVLLAHPRIDDGSIANRIIVDRVRPLEGVTVRDLYGECPSFRFDVASEQAGLVAADSVVFQFPFYWYGIPGIMKEWLDQVFTYGFAFGAGGDRLRGKHFVLSTTVGGPKEAYREGGSNNFTVEELLRPLQQTAHLTGMTWHPPIFSFGMIYVPGVYNVREEVEERAREHAERLCRYITS